MKTYTTILGDTWDGIAYKVFGQGTLMTTLMVANQQHMDTVIFSAGIVLVIPEVITEKSTFLPLWKGGL